MALKQVPNLPEILFKLSLLSLPGVGPARFKALLSCFGRAKNVFQLDAKTINEKTGLNIKIAHQISQFNRYQEIEKHYQWLIKNQIHILEPTSPAYPFLLKQIDRPPAVLFVWGNQDAFNQTGIAFVGSRKASSYGKKATGFLIDSLKNLPLTIVSGFARGIDICAHQHALLNNLPTIAVLAGGFQNIYPWEHKKFIQPILEKSGCLVTEFLPNQQALPKHFARRNRIISGLSKGVVLVEAQIKSGAMITARFAIEQNRELFVIPHPIFNPNGAGGHSLLKEGATLIENATDLVNSLCLQPDTIKPSQKQALLDFKPQKQENPSDKLNFRNDKQKEIYEFCQKEARCTEELVLKMGLNQQELMPLLTELEFQGFIKAQPGAKFLSVYPELV